MARITKEEFMEVIDMLESVYDKLNISSSKMTAKVWYAALNHFTLHELFEAVTICIQTERFTPTPSVIIEKMDN